MSLSSSKHLYPKDGESELEEYVRIRHQLTQKGKNKHLNRMYFIKQRKQFHRLSSVRSNTVEVFYRLNFGPKTLFPR